jgi:hypothetical protein
MIDETVTKLKKIADYFAEAKSHDLENDVLEGMALIHKLEKALDIYERERERFRHNAPQLTGEYFLAGGHGDKDDNMLPEYVRICPAYGCAWEQVYVKTDKTISFEGS